MRPSTGGNLRIAAAASVGGLAIGPKGSPKGIGPPDTAACPPGNGQHNDG